MKSKLLIIVFIYLFIGKLFSQEEKLVHFSQIKELKIPKENAAVDVKLSFNGRKAYILYKNEVAIVDILDRKVILKKSIATEIPRKNLNSFLCLSNSKLGILFFDSVQATNRAVDKKIQFIELDTLLNTLSKNCFLFGKGRSVFENDFFNLNYFVKKADTINLIFNGNKTISFHHQKLLNLKDTLGVFLKTYDVNNGKEYQYAQNKDSVPHYIFYKNREAIFTTITDPIKGYNTFPTYIVFNNHIYYGGKNKYDYDIYLHKWSELKGFDDFQVDKVFYNGFYYYDFKTSILHICNK